MTDKYIHRTHFYSAHFYSAHFRFGDRRAPHMHAHAAQSDAHAHAGFQKLRRHGRTCPHMPRSRTHRHMQDGKISETQFACAQRCRAVRCTCPCLHAQHPAKCQIWPARARASQGSSRLEQQRARASEGEPTPAGTSSVPLWGHTRSVYLVRGPALPGVPGRRRVPHMPRTGTHSIHTGRAHQAAEGMLRRHVRACAAMRSMIL